jgi:small subunit ribosomal protein S18
LTEQEREATEGDAAPAAPAAPPPAEAPAPAAEPARSEAPAAQAPAAQAPAAQAAAAPSGEQGGAPSGDRPPRPSGGDDRGDGRERRRRHFGRRKVCSFCVEKVTEIDYKDANRLRRYLSDRARIEPRRKTGTCAKHQRWLATALKRARHLALLPYTPEHIRVTGVLAGRR